MQSNGMRLLKLINDLLDLVRLESGRMEVRREPFDMADFIKGLASAARQVADDKRVRLETLVDPSLGTVVADHAKLEKIVLNLVFNALKFTPSGGRVAIRVEKQEDQFVLTVADTGMGISAKDLPNAFDRFWQADGSSKRKYQAWASALPSSGNWSKSRVAKSPSRARKAKALLSPCGCPIRRPKPPLGTPASLPARYLRMLAAHPGSTKWNTPAMVPALPAMASRATPLPPKNGCRICIAAPSFSPR